MTIVELAEHAFTARGRDAGERYVDRPGFMLLRADAS